METVISFFDFVFGCHHSHLSRVFTMGGRTYRVCCDCGANFRYSLATMCIEPGLLKRDTTNVLWDASPSGVTKKPCMS